MPRNISLSLEFYGKEKVGYKADVGTAYILKKMCGWSLEKKTKHYSYLKPPVGKIGAKKIVVNILVPTSDEILIIAQDLHSNGAHDTPALDEIFGWPALYIPRRIETSSETEVDVFTGERGKTEVYHSQKEAECRVGFQFIWDAVVRWRENGEPYIKINSGKEIVPDSSQATLFEMLDSSNHSVPSDEAVYFEGSLQRVTTNVYERNPEARKKCLEHFGFSCNVCGFDFAKRYGEIGEGFIHVHHLTPVSEIGEEYRIDPISDLRPVCPNCHSMLHQTSPPFSIDELKRRLIG